MGKNCSSCYYSDRCRQDEICEHYFSVTEEDEDINEIIEEGRIEYRSAWNSYLGEDEDTDYTKYI